MDEQFFWAILKQGYIQSHQNKIKYKERFKITFYILYLSKKIKIINNQQRTNICMIDGHEQRKRDFFCTYSECTLSRFACSMCIGIGNHKHEQYNQTHVLNYEDLQQMIKQKIEPRLTQLENYKEDSTLLMNQLKQKIQEIINSLTNIRKMIDHMEIIKLTTIEIKNNDYNEFDDNSLILVLNFDKYISDSYSKIQNSLSHINQRVIKIQQDCYSQQTISIQRIKDAKHKVITLDQILEDNKSIALAISNDSKFIVSGDQKKMIKIWNSNYKMIKSFYFKNCINYIQFTADSRLLYIGTSKQVYQFYLFKETYKQKINIVNNIYCITTNIILISTIDGTILKMDIENRKQLLLIKVHNERTNALDYNRNLNIIASASYDKSIKLWNGMSGQLILQKQNAFNKECKFIYKILFIINQNQLLSLDSQGNVVIWDINFEIQQLQLLKQISDVNLIYNISLVLNQQFITLVCGRYIKIYSIKGDYIREFNHNVKGFYLNNVIQHESMKAILIKGKKKLQVCKVYLD